MYTVKNRNPQTTYDIRVATVTSIGDSPYSDPLYVTTDTVNTEVTELDEIKIKLGITDIIRSLVNIIRNRW